MKDKASKARLTEQRIIAAAKKNPARFAPLYDIYYKQIFIYIFKKVKNEELCGDITSKVFLKALLNIGKYEDRGFPFSSWLYRIASNEVNMYFRSEKKNQEVELNENDLHSLMGEISESTEDDRLSIVINALNDLPLDQSELIDLRFFEKLSFKEIGLQKEISAGNAKIKVYRALDKLKKLILKTI